MDRTEIRIRAGLGERERELFVGIEDFGLKGFCIVAADDRVWNVVAIGPSHGGTDGNGQRGGAEAEVVNLYFACSRRPLRCMCEVNFSGSDYGDSECQRC